VQGAAEADELSPEYLPRARHDLERGEVLRALRIVEQDLFPPEGSERPCWAKPEAHTYRFTRQGDIIFVYVEEDLANCHRQTPAMDSGAKYAISVDGRIQRSKQ
jgi:hypothetical protein